MARWVRRVALGLGALLMVAGLALGTTAMVAPEKAEKVYGDMKVQGGQVVDRVVETVTEKATGERQYPTVRLGASSSDIKVLNRCDGSFFGMLGYQDSNHIIPVYAAHNNCGGDILLPWKVGTQVRVEGKGIYEVVDIRETKKRWPNGQKGSTDELVGLRGEFALQSCFYGENRMKFVGLSPVS